MTHYHSISSSSRYERGKLYSTASPFYDIYEGTLDNKPVFEQMFRLTNPQEASRQQSDGFIQMLSKPLDIWSRCNHLNIASFIGMYMVDDHIPSLLIAGYKHGFVKQYISNNPRCDRFHLILGIAKGLKGLHTTNPPTMHQDVRAENVVVDDNGEGCLTAIGTSLIRHPCSTDIDHIQLASSWIALEVLRPNVKMDDGGELMMTLKSDVYSFGMTVLEIFSGHSPFYKQGPYASILDALHQKSRLRLERSDYPSVPDDVWGLILRCTSEEPSERPSMDEVVLDIIKMTMKF